MSKKPKKKIAWQQYIAVAFFMLMGAACGVLMAVYIDQNSSAEKPIYEEILSLVALFIGMYIAILVQTVIHEAGHLVFGLISGYKFSSFRIFSFIWIKEGDRIRLRRMTIAGTDEG